MRKAENFLFILCVLLLFLSACSMQRPTAKVSSDYADKAKALQERLSQSDQSKRPLRVNYLTPLSEIRHPEVFVYKEKRRLYVVQSNVLVRDYPIGLGPNPKGDKQRQGDGRTPEGKFFICTKNPASRFMKSLGLNYPSRRHAERALFAGIINPLEFRKIAVANDGNGSPPWGTPLGGAIFIHGGGAHTDWTEGCIALYNSDMEELFTMASVGTPVVIRP